MNRDKKSLASSIDNYPHLLPTVAHSLLEYLVSLSEPLVTQLQRASTMPWEE